MCERHSPFSHTVFDCRIFPLFVGSMNGSGVYSRQYGAAFLCEWYFRLSFSFFHSFLGDIWLACQCVQM